MALIFWIIVLGGAVTFLSRSFASDLWDEKERRMRRDSDMTKPPRG